MIPPADDLDHIMAVMDAAFDPEFGEAWNRRQVEDALLLGNCHYSLAMEGNTCAGFFLSRFGFDEEELLLLGVAPAMRQRGYGAALLEQFLAAARTRGATRALLEMRQGNPAELLYRKAGFDQVGVRANYYRGKYGDRRDAITFACHLVPSVDANDYGL